jgi:hypothetical protein
VALAAPSKSNGLPNMPAVDHVAAAARRGKGWLIAAGVVAGLICLVLLVVGCLLLVRSFGKALVQGSFSALEQTAAATAVLANDVARANHLPDGGLTLALLKAQRPDVRWWPGGESVPTSGNQIYVSVIAEDDHVVTAVNLGICEYGLTVAAKGDPIVSDYHLAGVGTYLGESTQPSKTCSASSAPGSGWIRADNSVLRNINALPPG